MKYDFTTVNDRRNTGSIKWEVKENEIPMSIADMDFPTSPFIKKAIEKRAESGIYGYTEPSDEWYDAYISFFSDGISDFAACAWIWTCNCKSISIIS